MKTDDKTLTEQPTHGTAYRTFADQALHYFIRDHEAVPSGLLDDPAAWTGHEMSHVPEDWLVTLSDQDLREIRSAVDTLRASGCPMQDVTREAFLLPNLSPRITAWRNQVRKGIGFVILRGLPVKDWGDDDTAYAYWGLGHHLGLPGAQNPQNELLGHVIDYDEEQSNAMIRRYRTSGNIDFHCDAADAVALLCLRTAKSGGQSRIASSVSVFNEIYRREPDLIPRLFKPFYLDRRGEHRPGEPGYVEIAPCAWTQSKGLQTFYHSEYFRSAARHNDIEIDDQAARLLDLFDELCLSPDFHIDMWLEPGDIQVISNHTIVHARTDYEDWPEQDRRRHLLRLWLSF